MSGVLTRGTVVIDIDRCKGCELCIPACPPGVLVMSKATNAIGYRYPELSPGAPPARPATPCAPTTCSRSTSYDEPRSRSGRAR